MARKLSKPVLDVIESPISIKLWSECNRFTFCYFLLRQNHMLESHAVTFVHQSDMKKLHFKIAKDNIWWMLCCNAITLKHQLACSVD